MAARYSHVGIWIIEMLHGRLLIPESLSDGAIVLMYKDKGCPLYVKRLSDLENEFPQLQRTH